jgi:hypothetical protein
MRVLVATDFSADAAEAVLEFRRLFLRSMVLASSWPTWIGMRRDQQLTVVEARRVMEHTLRSLLLAARTPAG